METKREVMKSIAKDYLQVCQITDISDVESALGRIMERYDNASGDKRKVGTVQMDCHFSADRPAVHEMAMRLYCTGNYDFDGAYDAAVTLYEAGTAWERNSKEGE